MLSRFNAAVRSVRIAEAVTPVLAAVVMPLVAAISARNLVSTAMLAARRSSALNCWFAPGAMLRANSLVIAIIDVALVTSSVAVPKLAADSGFENISGTPPSAVGADVRTLMLVRKGTR